jgi:hypothetical protein
MSTFWEKLKKLFKSRRDSEDLRKCFQREDGKWYCYKKIAGDRYEECLPSIPYDFEEECMQNENC